MYRRNKHFMATADDKDCKHYFYMLKMLQTVVERAHMVVKTLLHYITLHSNYLEWPK